MSITNYGMTYHMGISTEDLSETVRALVMVGNYPLAEQYLRASGMDQEKVQLVIQNHVTNIQQQMEARKAKQEQEPSPEETVEKTPQEEPIEDI